MGGAGVGSTMTSTTQLALAARLAATPNPKGPNPNPKVKANGEPPHPQALDSGLHELDRWNLLGGERDGEGEWVSAELVFDELTTAHRVAVARLDARKVTGIDPP